MELRKKILSNEAGSLAIDLFGGAITSFQLGDDKVNPLSFRFSKEQMPPNNRAGAFYQGHFLCLGRWGEPSSGEIEAGLPDHGQIANILWKQGGDSDGEINMSATSELEGLQIDRKIIMDPVHPVYMVYETVGNINPLGRLYNMVQHPTIAAPFLDQDTIINCNARTGFNYNFQKDPLENASSWPQGITNDKKVIDVRSSATGCSSVFSFIVKKEEEMGWITAYSPKYRLVFGYLWKRKDYPWINLWQHWVDGEIHYRGLEFGTTGIHRPFHQILEDGNSRVFGEKTFSFIDAGQKVSRSYLSFLYKAGPGFTGVEDIQLSNGRITVNPARAGGDSQSLGDIITGFARANKFLEL